MTRFRRKLTWRSPGSQESWWVSSLVPGVGRFFFSAVYGNLSLWPEGDEAVRVAKNLRTREAAEEAMEAYVRKEYPAIYLAFTVDL